MAYFFEFVLASGPQPPSCGPETSTNSKKSAKWPRSISQSQMIQKFIFKYVARLYANVSLYLSWYHQNWFKSWGPFSCISLIRHCLYLPFFDFPIYQNFDFYNINCYRKDKKIFLNFRGNFFLIMHECGPEYSSQICICTLYVVFSSRIISMKMYE